jgi:hypothetical protein
MSGCFDGNLEGFKIGWIVGFLLGCVEGINIGL